MSEALIYHYLLRGWFVMAAVLFVVLWRIPAPYGRHVRAGWGPAVHARLGWYLMEAPASLLFLLWFLVGDTPKTAALIAFMAMWQAHYVHRAFLYPSSLGEDARPLPLVVMLGGMLFNAANTYLNGRYLFHLSVGYDGSWLQDWRFVAGVIVFTAGYALNRYSDVALRRERLRSGQRYCLMQQGVFRYVCCPNYLGEIVMWSGWALATWSLAGVSFAVWTAANLTPRARAHLRWCREYFERYPQGRRALFPGLW